MLLHAFKLIKILNRRQEWQWSKKATLLRRRKTGVKRILLLLITHLLFGGLPPGFHHLQLLRACSFTNADQICSDEIWFDSSSTAAQHPLRPQPDHLSSEATNHHYSLPYIYIYDGTTISYSPSHFLDSPYAKILMVKWIQKWMIWNLIDKMSWPFAKEIRKRIQ